MTKQRFLCLFGYENTELGGSESAKIVNPLFLDLMKKTGLFMCTKFQLILHTFSSSLASLCLHFLLASKITYKTKRNSPYQNCKLNQNVYILVVFVATLAHLRSKIVRSHRRLSILCFVSVCRCDWRNNV
jgi:hypothetical protein